MGSLAQLRLEDVTWCTAVQIGQIRLEDVTCTVLYCIAALISLPVPAEAVDWLSPIRGSGRKQQALPGAHPLYSGSGTKH